MSERKLRDKCLRWLNGWASKEMWWYCPADRFRSGIPDLLVCYEGRMKWIEFKTEKGRVTAIQAYTHERLRDAGAGGSVVRTFEHFKEQIMRIMKGDGTNG